MHLTFGGILLLIAGAVFGAPPKVPCSAPIPPEHGQAFLDVEGRIVKYACDPGYTLKGKEVIECVDGKWEEHYTACIEAEGESKPTEKVFNVTDESIDDAELPSLPADTVAEDDAGYQSDSADALRQLYWYAHYYHGGAPNVLTLTDSQIAWINSLHPELRDQYLRNAYIVRVGDSSEPKRMESIVTRDAYNYVYHVPYVRRPVSLIIDNVASTYDYTCNQAGFPVIPAPDLPNMHVARYDSRKNVYEPHNYYLSAVYQCDPGYYMLDSRYSELYCSRGQWVGPSPVCVANP